MQPKIQPLNTATTQGRTFNRTQEYTCTACGILFMGIPGQELGWPEPGHGLPIHCGHHDCEHYLQDLGLMRQWIGENGSECYKSPDGVHYRLTGHDALQRRVLERRQMVEEDQRYAR